MWEIIPALPTEITNFYISSCRGWYFFPPRKSANKHTYPSTRGHAEKHPSEPLFKKNRRLKKLVAVCGEENNLYIFHSITNIYTRDCICFHVQAQSGWQTFKHFRDEEKSLYSVFHCSQILPIQFKLLLILLPPMSDRGAGQSSTKFINCHFYV